MTAPLRFALVPVEPTPAMQHAADVAYAQWENGNCTDHIYPAMLAASPGNDLLERIVEQAARVRETRAGSPSSRLATNKLLRLIEELGGGHG